MSPSLTELRIDTEGFSLHVVKGGRDAAASGLPGGRRADRRPAWIEPKGRRTPATRLRG